MESPVPLHLSMAKISRPRGSNPVPRPRLFERLDALRQAPLVWIAAPPGSGKTTLVSSYLGERAVGGMWIQLSVDDADIATFIYYLGLTVEKAASRGGPGLPPLLPAFVPDLAAFARRCAEAIGARFDKSTVLVLDNYELVPPDAALHGFLHELASALPDGMSVFVLSRTEPPPPFARMWLNEGLVMLGAHELNVTRDEALAVVEAREANRAESPQDIADELLRRTEGWFAGFTLLLTDRRHANPQGVGAKTQQRLFDYFACELFERLDPSMQTALLRTALLPTMSVTDAQRVCGHAGVGDMLEGLHRRNCFVVQHGTDEPRYEYHGLFRAFLTDRAATRLPAVEWRELQLQSAELLANTGQAAAAASLYRAAGEWAALSTLALREAAGLIAAGRHRTLERWLTGLPQELLESTPWLRYWQAMACLPFDPAAARRLFEQAYADFDRGDDAAGLYTVWAGAMESFFFEWRDFRLADRWITEFETLRSRHPDFSSRAVELRTYCAMGTLLHRQPQHPMLPAWAERAKFLLDPSDRDPSVLLGGYLIVWLLWRGDAAEARSIIDRITPWVGLQTSAIVRILWACATGFLHSVRGDAERCRASIESGLAVAEQTGIQTFDSLLLAQMARCWLVAGDPDEAQSWMARMAAKMRNHSHVDGAFYQHLHCHAAGQRGAWQLAHEHGRSAMAMALESGVPFVVATCHIALARTLVGLRDAADGKAHIEAARAIGQSMRSQVLECLCLEVEARAALEHGDSERTRERLTRSLALSRAMDGSTWNVAGQRANALLYDVALRAGIEVNHVRQLIRRLGIRPPEPATAAPDWPWPIRVYTLGRFDVLIDDQPLRVSGKPQHKPLELLKCLSAMGGVDVRQEHLTDALWPEAEGDAAEQAFRTTLHRLRKLLQHDEAVRLRDRAVSFDARFVWADCVAFGRAAHLPIGEDKAAMRSVLSAYRGHFLQDESASWVIAYRARLRALYMSLVDRLGKRLEEEADWSGQVECYTQAIEIEPLAEGFYRSLMTGYVQLGRRSEAVQVYQRCRHILLTCHGISPSPQTQALHGHLVAT